MHVQLEADWVSNPPHTADFGAHEANSKNLVFLSPLPLKNLFGTNTKAEISLRERKGKETHK